jgi:hypothetical protein
MFPRLGKGIVEKSFRSVKLYHGIKEDGEWAARRKDLGSKKVSGDSDAG